MKRILILTTVLFMIYGISSAQTDADNFYKSDKVNVEKVSFPNLYKMKVGANLFLPQMFLSASPTCLKKLFNIFILLSS